jgi:RimJ/RimL family protein N-acetyltransferase
LGVIRATEADRAGIEAFLAPIAEYAMFPLANLRQHGMAGGHPNAVSFWICRNAGQISDVLCQTDRGMVMPVLPSQDYAAAARALNGRPAIGFVGPRTWVRGLQAASGQAQATSTLDHDEPHFLLEMADLDIPDSASQIVPLSKAPVEVIKNWMLDYQLRTLNTPPGEAATRVSDSYGQYTAENSHVVLMQGDTPLAMTGFNARLPDIVQIGGVYTPPDLRGKGHARRALALHLAQAKAAGVRRATLFSASVSATAAYRAIGFRPIGDWTLLLLQGRPVLHG